MLFRSHTMAGDRDKCLAVGMNDYVAKPIDSELLFKAIGNAVGSGYDQVTLAEQADDQVEMKQSPDELPGLDFKEGLARVGGSREVYLDILNEYCDFYQGAVREFTQLLDRADFEAARKKAHALKGAAGNISAVDLRPAAESLETACRESDPPRARICLEDVNSALGQLFDNVGRLKQGVQ